jgi:hypothetical protein
MKFDVYCDESRPDLFGSKAPPATYLVIGSLWSHREDRDMLKTEIHALRDKHKVGPEFKWQKVSTSRMPFYEELVALFFSQGDRLRFRCIAVDRNKVNLLQYHNNDQELGFYKFYYQLLHHWILDFNEYAIFCDYKRNRDMRRLHVLQRCLGYTNLSATVLTVQATPSHESVMVQFADLLTGAASARLNNSLADDSARHQLVNFLEAKLGRPVAPTWKSEPKFNVFAIDPKGGW